MLFYMLLFRPFQRSNITDEEDTVERETLLPTLSSRVPTSSSNSLGARKMALSLIPISPSSHSPNSLIYSLFCLLFHSSKKGLAGTSLEIQWLRLHAATAEGMGLTPG